MKKIIVFFFFLLLLSSFVPLMDVGHCEIQNKTSGIRVFLKNNNLMILDSIPIVGDDFLFVTIKEKTKIDLIKGTICKYYFKVSKTNKKKEKYFIAIYEYANCLIAKKNITIIDSLSNLNPKEIDPILFDFIHKSDEVYINIDNSIIKYQVH